MNESCEIFEQKLLRVKNLLVKINTDIDEVEKALIENPFITSLIVKLRQLKLDKIITLNELEDCEDALQECINTKK